MKTIYNLEVGDSYWIKIWTGIYPHPHEVEIKDDFEYNNYLSRLEHDMVSLTKEDCQREIDKKRALAKIRKRASELEKYWITSTEDYKPAFMTMCAGEVKFERLEVEFDKYAYKLVFDNYHIADELINELPEECKTVLEAD